MSGEGKATRDDDGADGDDLAVRRRRALYRANYRGTKEMDWLLGKFAARHVPEMSADELTTFEQFLAMSDPALQPWLLDTPTQVPTASPDPAFEKLVAAIRAFHGMSEMKPARGQ